MENATPREEILPKVEQEGKCSSSNSAKARGGRSWAKGKNWEKKRVLGG